MNSNKKVSIIIRTKNEERWIGHCIKRINSQNYKNHEIILVDSESTDNTVNKAKENGIEKLVKIKKYKPGLAINEGIRASSGELIVILSAHCLPKDENWLDDLTKSINSDKSLAGVYGKQVPMDFSSDDDKRDLLIVFGEDERVQIKDSFFHNANSIIRKDVWSEVNFNEEITNIEDRIWAQEVRVRTDLWADYVFAEDYKLSSLKEVEQYISENGHLPNVPSAKQVMEDGIEVGEMTKIQQEKIEELTLYAIAQDKQIDAQQKMLEEQQKQIDELKAAVKALAENKQ